MVELSELETKHFQWISFAGFSTAIISIDLIKSPSELRKVAELLSLTRCPVNDFALFLIRFGSFVLILNGQNGIN